MRAGGSDFSEDDLIARYFRPAARHPGAFDLADDTAAILPPAGCELVLQADAIVSSVHFFRDDPAETIGRKALRTNLSDLAAKGADPIGFLLSIAIPADIEAGWLEHFAAGLADDAESYKCALLGGDTVRSPAAVMISIAAFGSVPAGRMVRRKGARPGDRILVSGTIGDAALGLLLRWEKGGALAGRLPAPLQEHLRSRYLLPQPRMALAPVIRDFASAGMDISDGLVGDLAKLCNVSGVAARVHAGEVPLSAAAHGALAIAPDLLDTILTGGDDYEILCTVPSDAVRSICERAAELGVPMQEIGEINAGSGVEVIDMAGRAISLNQTSFSHF